jgi:hypothetical protein
MKRIPLLADCMLQISYRSSAAVRTVAFDANAGANTEGQFTFTVDGAATTVDCDAFNTLATLVAKINSLGGWRCNATPGLISSMSTELSVLTQRALSDMATTAVDEHGIKAMIFTNAYEVMPASATTALVSSVAIPTGNKELGSVVHKFVGADSGAAGNVTFNYIANSLGAPNSLPSVFPATAYEAAFGTAPIWSASPVEVLNGNTEVQGTTQVSFAGMPHAKLSSVINADNAVVNVQGWLQRP